MTDKHKQAKLFALKHASKVMSKVMAGKYKMSKSTPPPKAPEKQQDEQPDEAMLEQLRNMYEKIG